jgi:hypothetical protein
MFVGLASDYLDNGLIQGFERPDRQLLDSEALARHLVPQNSMFAFLAAHRTEVFAISGSANGVRLFRYRDPGSDTWISFGRAKASAERICWRVRGAGGVAQLVALLAANGNDRPATSSDARPCNACSNGASSHTCRHPATQ